MQEELSLKSGGGRNLGRVRYIDNYVLCNAHMYYTISFVQAYKMLTVSDNHFDLLKRFPSHFRFLVLQHSPDRYVRILIQAIN